MELREDLTIGKMLTETVERYADRTAVEYMGRTWTYGELDRISDKIAQEMLAMGIRKGSKAGIWANDRPDTLFCFLSLEKLGAVPVMFNTSWTFGEVQARVDEIGVEYLFYDEGYRGLDFVQAVREKTVSVPRAAVYLKDGGWQGFSGGIESYIGRRNFVGGIESGAGKAGFAGETESDAGRVDFAGEAECGADRLECAKAAVTPRDTDMILFTSGSTGAPRGVLTTHYSRSNNARAQAAMVKADCRDVFLVAIPMFHCFSMSGNILAAMAVGACICFPESRRTAHLLSAVERAGVTVLTAVPTLFSALLANERRAQYNTGTLRTGLVGGAGCPRALFEAVSRELHMELLPSLGQTEATAGITAGRYEDPIELRALSAGYAVEHLELRIVDLENGTSLPTGESGELCIRGYSVMQGYYNQPELTAQTIDGEGFLHTGDLGRLDKDGRLYLTGRKKELIIRGGENIAPGEIESVLLSDDRISQVKVIGIPDAHYGEEVCACVVCTSPGSLTEADIRHLAGAKLAYYKVPRYVVFLEQMPLLGNGKTDTAKLKCSLSNLGAGTSGL